MDSENIILMGMPGAGKSTIGVLLAKVLGRVFIDTDLLIQTKEKRLLQEIINERGVDDFLKIEEDVILGLQINNAVIATGGSVIYSDKAIEHLKQNGIAVYLKLDYEEVEQRIKNMADRGIVIGKGQSLSDLYHERIPMYELKADLILDCSGKTVEESVRYVRETLEPIMSLK